MCAKLFEESALQCGLSLGSLLLEETGSFTPIAVVNDNAPTIKIEKLDIMSVTTTPPVTTPTSCPVQPDCPPSGLKIDYYEDPFGHDGYTCPTASGSEYGVLPPLYYITEGLVSIESHTNYTTTVLSPSSTETVGTTGASAHST
jgi:hypothetical protein